MALPCPALYPIPRANHYCDIDTVPMALPTTYTIHLIETTFTDGATKDLSYILGSYIEGFVLEEILELYTKLIGTTGYIFPRDSIAQRMQYLNSVICWFGYSEGKKITCIIEKDIISAEL